jgi:hypothetical protein
VRATGHASAFERRRTSQFGSPRIVLFGGTDLQEAGSSRTRNIHLRETINGCVAAQIDGNLAHIAASPVIRRRRA